MKKILFLTLLCIHTLYAIDIDTDYLKQQLKSDPKNVSYPLILAKYYIQNYDYQQATFFLKKIDKIDPANKKAAILNQKINAFKTIKRDLGNIDLWDMKSIETYFTNLINKKAYHPLIKRYETLTHLHIPLTNKCDYYATKAYALTGDLHKAKLLMKIKDFPKDDAYLSLKIDLLLGEGELENAQKLYETLLRKYPNSSYLDEARQQINHAIDTQTNLLAKSLQNTNSEKNLFEYVYLLLKKHKQSKALSVINTFIDKNPTSFQAKLLRVKLYYWNGDLEQAFHKLYAFRLKNQETKTLYANILYERADYGHALVYLPTLAARAKSDKERYKLEKRIAFSYLHRDEKEKANQIFKKLLKENPNDNEIKSLEKKNKLDTLLNKAITAYKAKKTQEALALYQEYYAKTKNEKIAKEIAELYYFNKKFNQAIPYYTLYLKKYSDDDLIRFHYASSYEQLKQYKKSIPQFHQIIQNKDPKLSHLSSYHYAHNLMQLQSDKEWLQARKTLQVLSKEIKKSTDPKTKALEKYVKPLLETAMGTIKKPTYYKDIVLTEGSHKILNPKDVFAADDILKTTKNLSSKLLVHAQDENKQKTKPQLKLSTDYVHDSLSKYINYKIGVVNFLSINGIRYSLQAQKFYVNQKQKKSQQGNGISFSAQKKKIFVSIGIDKFRNFTSFTQKLTWNPTVGIHELYMDFYHKNGLFSNYRNCMIETKDSLFHAGLQDHILMDDLNYVDLDFNVNAYKDHNINFNALLNYPLFNFNAQNINHTIIFNENLEYNTKTDVYYLPAKRYDATYLKYNPKYNFKNGSLSLSLGTGYSFSNSEQIYSYAFSGSYDVEKFATFEISCERVQSSFTSDDIDYCTFNIIQDW